MQYIFYVQRIPPYSAFWTENPKRFQKCKMGMSHICQLTRNFYVTSGSDVYSKMTQYGTSTSFSFTAKKGCTKSWSGVRSREQKGLVTHPDSGPELQLYSKTTSLR
jgi:hypothetical protein